MNTNFYINALRWHHVLWLFLCYGGLTFSPLLWAQDVSIELDPSDGSMLQNVGAAVAISDQVAVIGAPGDASGRGAAYVYQLQSGTWTQIAKIVAADGANNDHFGASVAAYNDLIVVGAPKKSFNQGAVYIFAKSGSAWLQVKKLTASDGLPNSLFGASVSIDGSYIAVGAPEDNQLAEDAGAAYLFSNSTNNVANWTQLQKVTATDGVLEDEFGCSVSLRGNRLAVGARYSDVPGSVAPTLYANAGAAYLFTATGNTWLQTAKRTATVPGDTQINDYFGCSVSLTDNFLLVGAYGDDAAATNAGAIYVFSGAGFATLNKITPIASANSQCGFAVAISQNTLVAGCRYANSAAGRARVYTFDGSIWQATASLLTPTLSGSDAAQFGASVAIANNVVLVGAPEEDANGSNSGSVYLYEMLAQPLAVNASDGGFETHVQVAWTPRPGTSATSYKVYKYKNDTLVATFNNPTNPFNDTDVLLGTNYSYCVAAVSTQFGESQALCDMGFKGTIAAPNNFNASDGLYENQIVLTWGGGTALNVQDSILVYKNGGIIDTLDGAINTYTIMNDIYSGISYDFCLQRYYTQRDTTFTLVSTTFDLDTITTNISSLSDPLQPYLTVLDTLGPTDYLVITLDTFNLVQVFDTMVLATPILSELVCNTGNIDILAPGILTASYQTYEDHVALSWGASSSAIAQSYKIYRNGSLLAIIPNTFTQFDDYNAVTGELYEYCIVALSNTFGESAESCDFGGTLLLPPTSVAASDGTFENKINITWTIAPTTVAEGVRIYRNSVQIADLPAFLGATGFDDANVQGLNTYDYCIETYHSVWGTSTRTCNQGNINIIKPQLTATNGTPSHEDRVVLSWSSPSALDDGFLIYRNNTLLATINNSNTLTYTDLGVTSLTQYEYTIAAYDVNLGNSERDTAVGMAKIKTPTSLSASIGTYPDKIQVAWANASSLTGVQYRLYRNGILATTLPAGTTSYLDQGLNAQNIIQYCLTTYKVNLGESQQVCTTGQTSLLNTGTPNSTVLNAVSSTKIIPPGTGLNGSAGIDVDISAEGTAVVGVPDIGCLKGVVSIFTESDNIWVQQQELEGGDCGDRYGASLSLDGEYLAVGSPNKKWHELRLYYWNPFCAVCDASNPCAIYTVLGTPAIGCGAYNNSEYSPSLSPFSGVDLRQPFPMQDQNGNFSFWGIAGFNYQSFDVVAVGQVRKYQRSGNTWPLVETINVPTSGPAVNPGSNEYFGSSLDLQGSNLGIGAKGPGPAGAYQHTSAGVSNVVSTTYYINDVATHASGIWGGDPGSDVIRHSSGSTISAPIAGTPGFFGRSIAINGNQMIVGGPDYVAFYNYTGTGGTDGWHFDQLLNSTAPAGANFGYDVALKGDYALVGAPSEDSGKGFAYLLQKVGSTWQIVRRVAAFDAAAGDSFGISVAMEGDYAIVGAPYDDNGSGTNAGAAYIFKIALPEGLSASDGTFSNKVQLAWENDSYEGAGITGLKIYRDNIFIEDIGGTTSSTYNDLDAVPGQLHQYCIETYGNVVLSLCDYGFVRPNGRISGAVTTQQQAGVSGVRVCAYSPEGQSALAFSTGGTMSVSTGINLNNSPYTLEYWAKSNTVNNNFILFGDGGSNNIAITVGNNNYQWHHYAQVFNGSQFLSYVDGQLTTTTLGIPLNTTSGNLQVGGSTLTVIIDELRIWDIERTQIDIEKDMGSYLRGNETGLKGYWSFNEGKGNTAGTSVQGSNAHGQFGIAFWTYDRPDVNYCATTDASGYYEIANIGYGEEREFTVIPSKDDHDFSPDQQVRTITTYNNLANNVNFTDNSTFTVEGDIYYNGTVCKQGGVRIMVNGVYMGNDTDAQGHFAISIAEPDTYILTPVFQDHSFVPAVVNLGYVEGNQSGIVIQNTTLRTITGTVTGACNALIGDVTVQVASSPSCISYNISPTSSPYSFNPDNGRFQIQVPPLKYNVRVNDVQEGGQVNVQAINYFFSRSQATNLVDSTNVEDTLHFVFNKPFVLEIEDLPATKTCDGLAYVLSTDAEHPISFNIYQNYNGDLCPADSGTIYINDNVSGVGAVSMPFYNGAGFYNIKPDYPNIVAPYLKTFYVSAEVNGGYTETQEIKVLVTGSKPRESTFITKFPERPDFMIRDPAGDGSYGYISLDTTICNSRNWMYEVAGSFGNNQTVNVGAKFIVGLGFAVQTEIENTLRWDMSLGVGSDGEGGIETCVTALQEFKTPSNPLFAGKEGNTYIGGGLNMIYAASDVIAYNNCNVKRDTILAIAPLEYRTKFIYTQNHIKVSLMPQLESLANIYRGDSIDALASGNTALSLQKADSMRLYLIQKDLWNKIISIDDSLTTVALAGAGVQNYSFSSGASFQNETSTKTTETSSYSVFQTLDTEIALEISAKVNNTGVEASRYVRFTEKAGKAWADATEYNNKVGYVFTDDDIGDYFSIDVGKDKVYGVPVFKTISGRSSCPHELNTQSRDLPYIVLNSPAFQGGIPPDDAAVFNINFGNASPSGEAWPFRIQALTANNLYGATVLLNGSMETGGTVDYFIPAGQEIQSQVYVTRGPTEYNYDNLAVMIYTPCEYVNWANGGSIGNADTVFFSVHFESPCSDIALVTPIDNWLVQQQDNNNLQITLSGYDATGLNGVVLEYRDDAAGGAWIMIDDIDDSVLLNATYPDSYTYNWNVGSLPDGNYIIRAVSYCQTASGSATSSSQELHGVIDRSFNGLFGTPQPSDGLLEPGDEVSINFNESINCLQPLPFTPSTQIVLIDISTGDTLQYGANADYYVQCNGSGINFIINPNKLLALDGRLIQAQVAGIKDINGNVLLSPEVWSFIVLQREAFWNPTIINLTMYQGDSQTLPIQLVNSSPLPRQFQLSVSNAEVLQIATNGNTSLLSGNSTLPVSLSVQTATLAFDSTYTDTVKAAIYNSAGTAIEYYSNAIVSTTVLAKPPIWEINPFEFEYGMNMVVQLDIDPDPDVVSLSQDEFDKVAAFSKGQIRGVANIERSFTPQGWKYLAFLDVYSHNAFGDSLSFRLWDADEGKQYGSEEDNTIIFADGSIVGSNSTPKILHAKGLVQCITLQQGWNWISFNVEAQNMSLNQVLEGLRYSQTGDVIKSQTGYAQYQNGLGWVGNLNGIANGESYMIYIQAQTDELCLVGEAIDATANSIVLDPGWNWLGYTAQTPDSVNNVMTDANFVLGDIMRSQTDGFAQHNGTAWANGNLQVMQPGKGYKLYVQNPMNITYPMFLPPNWSYNPSCYEYSMTITGILSVNLIESTDIDDLIAASVMSNGNVCSPTSLTQGTSMLRFVPEINRYIVFLTIYGDAASLNQPITFRMYDSSGDEIYTLDAALDPITGDTIRFIPDNRIGTLQQPYPFRFSTCDEVTASATESGCTGNEGTASADVGIYTGRRGKTCADPDIITTATGTNTTYTTAISPFATAWKKTRFQYLYTAAELRNAGLAEGTISRIGFNVVQKQSVLPIQNYTVKMMGTNQTALNSNAYTIGTETVYEGNYTTQVGWNEIILDYAFDWDGVSNIIIQVCYDSQNEDFYNDIVRTANTSYVSTIGMFDDVGAACAFETPQIAYNERPILRLGACNIGYIWSNGENTPLIENLVGGDYTVTVSFGNGCTEVRTVTVASTPVMIVSPSIATAALCNGAANGVAQAVITGGTPPYSYLWNNGQTTATATGLAAGTYTATVTDANTCTTLTTAIITEPTALTANIGAVVNVVCNNGATGSASVTYSGGTPPYSFLWSNGQTTATATGLIAGTYSATVTDAHNCTKVVNNIVVAQAPPLAATVVQTSSTCNGLGSGAATVSASGGTAPYSFVWSNGQTTASVSNLNTGTYSITVQDVNGCSLTLNNVTINAPAILSASLNINHVACNGGSTGTATVLPVGGTAPYAFVWSNGQVNATAINLSAGTYSATVTDANNCTATVNATLTQPAAFTVIADGSQIISSSLFAHQTEVNVTGGVLPYIYNWDNNGYVNYDIVAPGHIYLAYGQTATWAVTITDANGCGNIALGNLPTNVPLAITNFTIQNDNGSSSGSIDILVTGGTAPYFYDWYGPSGWTGNQNADNLQNLPYGWYNVHVSDAVGNSISGWYWVGRSQRGRDKTDMGTATLSVYPNPLTDNALIVFEPVVTERVRLELFDASGRLAMQVFEGEAIADESLQIAVSAGSLTPGTYTCRVSNTQGILSTIRLVVAQ